MGANQPPTKEFECFDLPGFTSTTEQFKIAFDKSLLAFASLSKPASASPPPPMLPVVFVMTIKEPSEMRAFRMNEEYYSAYPDEFEVVLQAGTLCYVLRVEEIVFEYQ